jgi:hypothetical protein
VSDHFRARLINAEGELLAEGPCWFDQDARLATMEPERAPGVIQKERGRLTLELDSGDKLAVSDRPIVISTMGQNGSKTRRRLYRLRLIDATQVPSHNVAQDAPISSDVGALAARRPNAAALHNNAQDATAVGAVDEGAATSQDAGPRPRAGETPAAR